MSEYTHAISAIQGEIAAIEARRARLVRALEGLQSLEGELQPQTVLEAVATDVRAPQRRKEVSPAPQVKVPGPLPDTASMAERILAVLREHGPITPSALATRVGLNSSTAVRYHLKPMVTRGVVVESGNRLNALFSLPLKTAAPTQKPSAASKDYDVAWSPHRDAPSLSGEAGGLGSTLGGSDFKVHR